MAIYTDMNSTTQNALDVEAINNAIKNILLTDIGSMPGKPTFGSNILKYLFVNIDHITSAALVNSIEEALGKWEPRIIVNNVVVKEVPEYNKIIADIDYQYRDKGLNVDSQISVSLVN